MNNSNTFEGKSLNRLLKEEVLLYDSLPYERFIKYGEKALTDTELIAVLLRTGTRKSSALDIGKKLLDLGSGGGGALSRLNRLSLKEMMEIDGVGEVKAVRLKCVCELARRMAAESCTPDRRFSNAQDVASVYMERLRHEEQERVILLSLNTGCMLLEESLISIGTVNQALLSPREIYRCALKAGAVMIIVLHNHPGGDPKPSGADIAVTDILRKAGESIGIKLVDHIIIGDMRYLSFREEGLLKED